jgi:protein-S-isoprenylcysteine O-methyltransferase Ste14
MKIVIILSWLFLFSEFLLAVSKRSRKNNVKRKKDRGSLVALYFVFTISITLGFFLANYRYSLPFHHPIMMAGILVYLFGVIIRWTAIIQLKMAFTVDVVINKGQKLKTNGLYRIVRHPSYLGLFMIFAGLAISMNSLLSFIVIILPVFLVILYRIHVEESLLCEEFGDEYKEYKKNTRKIIPYVY